jgi:hypothetical protein
MKGIKLSRTSWLILSAGVFVVILAGLGVTRSQQVQEQASMNDELSLSKTRLDKIDVTTLKRQLDDLNQQVESGQAQLDDARKRLRQTVVSVDVTDELFKIAAYSGVTVMNLTTSTIADKTLEGIGLKTISLNIQAKGDLDKIVNFVINLNNGFATGYVQSAQISIPTPESEQDGDSGGNGEVVEETAQDETTVSVQMVVYSYEGD